MLASGLKVLHTSENASVPFEREIIRVKRRNLDEPVVIQQH